MNESQIETVTLAELWDESVAEPRTLVETDDPKAQAGTFVIEPGERIPAEGTTSHGGTELSVVLSGSVVVGESDRDAEVAVAEGDFVRIPAGVEHYSRNDTDRPVKLVYVILGDL